MNKEKAFYRKQNWCKKKDCENYPHISNGELIYNPICFHCKHRNKEIDDFYSKEEKQDFYLEEEI